MESLGRFLTPLSHCEYLPDRMRRLRFEIVRRVTPAEYADRMRHGWRRFGHSMFIHDCPSCSMCQSVRVPIATFRPDRSQMRAWKANREQVRIAIGSPSLSKEKQALYLKFQRHQHDTKGWTTSSGEETLSFVDNPFPTEEWCYYVENRLVAVGYVDNLPEALSAITFYYDPDERHRSLGTFNVLSVIEAARLRHRPYAYLGYYVEGCRSLEYKARFRPNEVLGTDGVWVPFRS
jgi:arginine-tRNA-protein transferase